MIASSVESDDGCQPLSDHLGPLALRQVEHESDTLIPAFLEGRHADQHGDTAAVFPKVLLLKRLKRPGHLVLLYQSRVAIAPLRRREVRPPYTACDKVLMIVPHDVEKGFIGLQNPAVEIPDKDADDVGVDQAPNLRFASRNACSARLRSVTSTCVPTTSKRSPSPEDKKRAVASRYLTVPSGSTILSSTA